MFFFVIFLFIVIIIIIIIQLQTSTDWKMGGAIYKDSPAIKYEERNIYLNSIQSFGRYLSTETLSTLSLWHFRLRDRLVLPK